MIWPIECHHCKGTGLIRPTTGQWYRCHVCRGDGRFSRSTLAAALGVRPDMIAMVERDVQWNAHPNGSPMGPRPNVEDRLAVLDRIVAVFPEVMR